MEAYNTVPGTSCFYRFVVTSKVCVCVCVCVCAYVIVVSGQPQAVLLTHVSQSADHTRLC